MKNYLSTINQKINFSKKLGELLFQIIPVMIGVYLGFLVTDWKDQNKRQKQADQLINNIISEIEINEKRIQQNLDYHIMLKDSSRHYARSKTIITDKPDFFKGTRIAKLTNSAYTTGIQTGIINELPMKKIQFINQLYTFQNDYNEFGNLLMAGLINKDFSGPEDIQKVIRYLSMTMTDVVIKEKDLLGGYKAAKKGLKKEG